MSVKAYILIDTSSVRTTEILEKLRSVDGISSAEAVSGPHDIVVAVETDGLQSLGDIILTKIRTIEGVTKTITCCCVQ
ncbi:MAG: Lrp/AsnC family transcriptional regulator [Planctomycetes bacterium]|nr:Lrp/AsnC family transcriptional regulator [Planctomycetota bacterium]